jgi:hypothetical protein
VEQRVSKNRAPASSCRRQGRLLLRADAVVDRRAPKLCFRLLRLYPCTGVGAVLSMRLKMVMMLLWCGVAVSDAVKLGKILHIKFFDDVDRVCYVLV